MIIVVIIKSVARPEASAHENITMATSTGFSLPQFPYFKHKVPQTPNFTGIQG